jgi:UDP-2-acetamido-3-amino-2,3-dideoxy-glucuronate N-acetyltransferase
MNYTISDNSYIGKNVKIGDNTVIGRNVTIHDDTIIGANVVIQDNTILGKPGIKSARSKTTADHQVPPTVIGNDCNIASNVMVSRGATLEDRVFLGDKADVREDCTIGHDTIIGRAAYIENKCDIGHTTKIQANVYITSRSQIGNYCFIAPGVMTSNDVYMARDPKRVKYYKGLTLKDGARIGVGATILPGITIHEDAMIAAGALVTKDVPSKRIFMGVPAKDYGPVKEEQLLENQPDYKL